jgi:hypothetical protein
MKNCNWENYLSLKYKSDISRIAGGSLLDNIGERLVTIRDCNHNKKLCNHNYTQVKKAHKSF